mgnify:CR=1 FL=1
MAETKKIPERCDVPEQETWNLADIYPTTRTGIRTRHWCTEGESAATLYEYMTLQQEVDSHLENLAEYAQRKSDQDTRVGEYQAMTGKIMSLWVEISSAAAFETPEVLKIPQETLERFYRDEPRLEHYRRYFQIIQDRRAHILSDAEEKLLASAGEMSQAPDTIYGSLTDADMKFPDAVDAKGNKHPLTQGTFVSLEESSDRVLRQSAYENLYGTLASFKTTTAAILNAQNKQLKFFAEARKYDTAFEASLDATNVPTSVYKNLIETVHQNMVQEILMISRMESCGFSLKKKEMDL